MTPEQRTAFPLATVALKDGATVTLRLLTPADGERLARFYATVPKEDYRFYCPHRLDRENALANAARADKPGQFVLVVEDSDGEIAGYAWVRQHGDTGTFGACLRKDVQGRGLGSRLVARLFEIIDRAGPTVVDLTVQTANPAAVALYRRNGFRVVKEGLRRADPTLDIPEEPQFWMERVRKPICELRNTVRIAVPDSADATTPDGGGPPLLHLQSVPHASSWSEAGPRHPSPRPAGTAALAAKAGELLGRTVTERTGLSAAVAGDGDADIVLCLVPDLSPEAYRIAGDPRQGEVRIEASDGRGLIYGVGRFLRESVFEEGCLRPAAWRGTSPPINPVRAMYFASHFHNWYHDAPVPEVARYVEELALYGCNCLSVWFDLHHYENIDTPDAREMIQRLRAVLAAANGVGMGASLTLLGNEGFTSTPDELKATNDIQNGYHGRPGGFYNTEICPSQPGGMDLILANRRAVFEAFAGIDFDYIWIWPYDQGGCTCADCAPWGSNGFLRTAGPVADLIKEHFPEAKVVLSTWYFDRFIEGEWAQFDKLMQQEKPAWIDYLLIDGFKAFPEYPLEHGVPGNYPVVGFPEISMEGNSPWGGYGANPRPEHWADYWGRSKRLQSGNFPYSEGIYEDVNKFLMLQLNWFPDRHVDSILREYARGWFGPDAADSFVEICHLMEADESTVFGRVNITGDDHDDPPSFSSGTGLPRAAECEEKVAAIDNALPETVRSSWRWRLFRLRARIDAQLKATGLRFNDTLDADFAELSRIYHATADSSRGCVLPPRRNKN